MSRKSLSEIKKLDKAAVASLVASLKDSNPEASKAAGLKLARDADQFGINLRDYLMLSVQHDGTLNGYEQVLFALDLPTKDNFEHGIHLQAAADTFQTYPGTRALFPEVMDDVLRWAAHQDQVESVDPLLASSRTIDGNEMISTVVDPDLADGENDSFQVPELGRIPVRQIRTSQTAVKIWKHGSGISTSYEYQRRASLDLLKPHANRIARELELSKLRAAVALLINGDGVNPAAAVKNQSSFDTPVGTAATDGKISWMHFMYWLVQRAKAGKPVDTVAMNWDGAFQWLMMFGNNTANMGPTAAESLSKSGVDITTSGQILSLLKRINPVVASGVAAGQMIGLTKGDTIEELREAGSDINETERAIQNQSITMIRTENTGYRLIYPDTREIFDFAN